MSKDWCDFISLLLHRAPILQLWAAVSCPDRNDRVTRMLSVIGVTLSEEEACLTGEEVSLGGCFIPVARPFTRCCVLQLFHCVMRKWMPLGEAVFGLMATHLPSPATAQQSRFEKTVVLVCLYTCTSMCRCVCVRSCTSCVCACAQGGAVLPREHGG